MGTNLGPWLPGNWYRSPSKERSLWLIGLGVRLGTGSSIEEAESNSKKEVNIARTYLRVHTGDGIDIFRSKKKHNEVDL